MNSVFDAIDIDGDGGITLDELDKYLAVLEDDDRARKDQLVHRTGDADAGARAGETSADEADAVRLGETGAAAQPLPKGARAARLGFDDLGPSSKPVQGSTANATSLWASEALEEARQSAVAVRPQNASAVTRSATRTFRLAYQDVARRDLDKGVVWKFKTFTLFPLLNNMRYLDFVFRAVFPVAYLIFVIVMFQEVDYSSHFALLDTAPCYRAAIS